MKLMNALKEPIASTKCIMHRTHKDKITSVLKYDMTKEEIRRCKYKYFRGNIVVITSEYDERKQENRRAIEKLRMSKVLGFDTETRVTFQRPVVSYPIGLIQLSNEDTAVLWRLRRQNKFLRPGFPSILKNILQDKDIKKVGTGTDSDRKGLYEQYNVNITSLYDNQHIARQLGFVKLGLSSLSAQLFGWTISKKKCLSNWEAYCLDDTQTLYGATDAWASLCVYLKLFSMVKDLDLPHVALPPYIETVLSEESKTDRQIFRVLDKKLFESATIKIGADANRDTKKRRQTRKVDHYNFETNLNSHLDLLDEELHSHTTTSETKVTCQSVNINDSSNHAKILEKPFIFRASLPFT